ncbi:MAG TPA: magnesium/cobalt transporter CorA [bacterium]|nr:magnesium/cobalt transporter CorA [bacterium]
MTFISLGREILSSPVKAFKNSSKKAGLPPGTLVYIGDKKDQPPRISVIDYTSENIHETEMESTEKIGEYKNSASITWINVEGIHDTELIQNIGSLFDLHPLVLEDIVHTGQRPKIEDYGEYLFIVLKMFYTHHTTGEIISEQVSLVIFENCVISFQELRGDIFDPLRKRIRNAKGRIRRKGSDYLAYTIIDTVADHYFIILEGIGTIIEDIEEQLTGDPSPESLQAVRDLKKQCILMRKSIWPLREVLSSIVKEETKLINPETIKYFTDVYDHTIQVVDSVETFRDMLSGMTDLYLSSISWKTNEVMKVLTIIATVFIPLSFFAGVFGMNFTNMPELSWKWSYPVFWLVIILISAGMIFYFKKKKWL